LRSHRREKRAFISRVIFLGAGLAQGERCRATHWKTTIFTAGLRHDRFAAPMSSTADERRGLAGLCRTGAKDQPLPDRIFVWHLICGFLIALIVALHIAGALYHWLVKGDRVLQRLL